jgi:hypothetical protein
MTISILPDEELAQEKQAPAPSIAVNTTTKTELLSRAKAAIESGERAMHQAAEALALAQQDFNATQREIARAVGKSVAWVNRLLQWQRGGCPGTPFGPGSKDSRKRRKRVQATEQRAPGKSGIEPKAAADEAVPGAESRKVKYAKQEADPSTPPPTEAERPPSRKISPAEAKNNLRFAIDHWWPHLDHPGKAEMTTYFLEKTGGGRHEQH